MPAPEPELDAAAEGEYAEAVAEAIAAQAVADVTGEPEAPLYAAAPPPAAGFMFMNPDELDTPAPSGLEYQQAAEAEAVLEAVEQAVAEAEAEADVQEAVEEALEEAIAEAEIEEAIEEAIEAAIEDAIEEVWPIRFRVGYC